MTAPSTMVVAHRFRGPTTSGNGGITCGLVARSLDGPAAEVTLRAPPPLDEDLVVRRTAEGVEVHHRDLLVATGRAVDLPLEAPEPVSFEAAHAARAGYHYIDEHPFPECFVCGPARDGSDGLCLFPGPIPGREIVATSWVPAPSVDGGDGLVAPEVVWGALDCPSYAGLWAGSPVCVLGRLSARIARRPRVGERCVVLGWRRSPPERRKHFGGSAIYGEGGDLLGVGHAIWIAVDG